MYVPVVCEPWLPPHGLEDYICSSWKTLIAHQQQTPGDPGIACSPAWPIKYIKGINYLPSKNAPCLVSLKICVFCTP